MRLCLVLSLHRESALLSYWWASLSMQVLEKPGSRTQRSPGGAHGQILFTGFCIDRTKFTIGLCAVRIILDSFFQLQQAVFDCSAVETTIG